MKGLNERYTGCSVIFSVGISASKGSGFLRWANIKGIDVALLQGSYKGIVETSFLTSLCDFSQVGAWVRDEEAVLLLSATTFGRRMASLKMTDGGRLVHIGEFKEVSIDVAHVAAGYTYDIASKKYYTTVKS